MRRHLFLLASSCVGLVLFGWLLWTFHPWERLRQAEPALPALPLRQPLTLPTWTSSSSAVLAFPKLTAQAVFVWEANTGTLLYQDHADLAWQPASTAKMMTALITRQHYQPETVLPVTKEAATPGSTANILSGQMYRVYDLLQALLIPSGNDAAAVLANHYPGGEVAFVAAMNTQAQLLGLNHTNFVNPAGLDAVNQFTTARDLAILGKAVITDPVLKRIVAQPIATISSTITTPTGATRSSSLVLKNTDELLGKIPGIAGIKTGTTAAAGENFVSLFSYDGHDVVIVLLGSQNRYNEVEQILSWLQNFTWQTYGRTD